MMVCSKSMINIATRMQQRWGIPYFEGSFYGISDMNTTLREIARLLVERGANADLKARAEALIAAEEARAWERIRAYRERLSGKKVLLIAGGVKSWSVVSALQEAGLEVVGTSVKKSTREDKEKIREIMGLGAADDAHMIDDLSPREMYAMLRDAKADIMLSGGRSQFVALKARMPWMDINQERHHAFAGYEGMVTMIAEIDKALFNPMWREVRTPAPWETVDPLLAA
jgi:nitrogenase molybdenum-cofactor synthesis protein NifE